MKQSEAKGDEQELSRLENWDDEDWFREEIAAGNNTLGCDVSSGYIRECKKDNQGQVETCIL